VDASSPLIRLNRSLQDRYRIEREVGEGGMAKVYLADDLRHERKVALKVLKPELAAVVGAERFLAEIKTTANLQHPHILPLFDSGEADGFLFYVMPYVEGESLRERLEREHQLPVDEALRIAMRVAEALDYAHRRGVIHRDIKPANILLQDGNPVIADFGIALAVGAAGGGRLTKTGLSLGTPHYMSPEQATGDQAVHVATDIYALACVLYEMLVGEPPYTGSTAQAILGQVIQAKRVSAAAARRSVPAHVDAVIGKALERVAADRFTTARDVAAALGDKGFRHGEPEDVDFKATRWRTAGVAAVLASAVTGTVVWTAASEAPSGPVPVVRFPITLPGGGALRGNTWQMLELTRDGRALVINALTGESDGSQLFVRPLESLEAIPIRGTEGAASFFLSPDGRSVGFDIIQDDAIRGVPLAGGTPSTITESGLAGGNFLAASWGEGGRIVFSTGAYAGLMDVREGGGSAEPLTTPLEATDVVHLNPHFLPGGEDLLFEIRGTGQAPETFEIVFLSLATGEYASVTNGSYPHYVEGGYLVFRRGTTLWGVAFDPERGLLQGDAVPVLEGLREGAPQTRYFSVSRGGTLAYVPEGSGGSRTLVELDRTGRETALEIEPEPYTYPRISPNGDQLAVAANNDLWVFDLDRGFTRTRITYGGSNGFYPTWTPDGSRLTYSDGPITQNRLLWSAADGGGGTDTLLAVGDHRRLPTSWHPDGRTLAYYAGPAGTPTSSRDVWLLHVEGDSRREEPFVATPFEDFAPAFSPDGRWIAYVSNRSDRDEVYVRPYPGPGPESTVSNTGGREPVWSRDGTELFYRTEDQLMVVDVQLGDSFRAGQPRSLFADFYERDGTGIANYDITTDGEHFVMVRHDVPTQDELIVVVNWVEELRRLLSN
jgi:Tol biopolymer transport system component